PAPFSVNHPSNLRQMATSSAGVVYHLFFLSFFLSFFLFFLSSFLIFHPHMKQILICRSDQKSLFFTS
ncbi:hypothetical protein, partial [Salmonella enterica]|uniref:hypothetical protein n=1 Tax=Salmonella enterica TaxID=28901 RepID=UPI001A7E0D2E